MLSSLSNTRQRQCRAYYRPYLPRGGRVLKGIGKHPAAQLHTSVVAVFVALVGDTRDGFYATSSFQGSERMSVNPSIRLRTRRTDFL